MVTTRPPKTIVKPTALGPVANTDTKLLIYGLFQKGRVLAQDGIEGMRAEPVLWIGLLRGYLASKIIELRQVLLHAELENGRRDARRQLEERIGRDVEAAAANHAYSICGNFRVPHPRVQFHRMERGQPAAVVLKNVVDGETSVLKKIVPNSCPMTKVSSSPENFSRSELVSIRSTLSLVGG